MNNNWSGPLVHLARSVQRAKELAAEGRFGEARGQLMQCRAEITKANQAMQEEQRRRESLEKPNG